eukprot:CAMPEP_0196594984 /NCGR_PEP_ID=MMETSP1081-20130531/79852_1 /TAXON_ID=36882 /ORGANISM="Pyramimonas amylifera, Strain CCMP720" /LENGTH=203 /DNA_ID=CAMNT_0041919407 /DNA_START=162 /DNA_END=769 /DNA_ORIENTATION=-
MDLEDAEEREKLVVKYNRKLLLKIAEIDEERTASINLRQDTRQRQLMLRSQSSGELSRFVGISTNENISQEAIDWENSSRVLPILDDNEHFLEVAPNSEEHVQATDDMIWSRSNKELSGLEKILTSDADGGITSTIMPKETSQIQVMNLERTVSAPPASCGCYPERGPTKLSEHVIQFHNGEKVKTLGMVQALKDGLLFGSLT